MKTSPRQRKPLVTPDPAGFGLPGAVLVVDPDEADELGAFPETALTPEDAWESNSDEAQGKEP
jgi:hypothetical protein